MSLTEPINEEQLQKLADDPNLFHIAFNVQPPRPGARLFAMSLEYNHFKPSTPKNDEYKFILLKWCGMLWAVVSIPASEKHIAYQVAAETGMHIADGYPICMEQDGTKQFPMASSFVHTLENDAKSPLYTGIVGQTHVLEFEEAAIEKLISEHEAYLDKKQENSI